MTPVKWRLDNALVLSCANSLSKLVANFHFVTVVSCANSLAQLKVTSKDIPLKSQQADFYHNAVVT